MKVKNEERFGWPLTVTQPKNVAWDWLAPESSRKAPPPTHVPQRFYVAILKLCLQFIFT